LPGWHSAFICLLNYNKVTTANEDEY